MARITVEDCLNEIDNRFDLVLLASIRAKDIAAGDSPRVLRDNDKNSVVALREIAEKMISHDELVENAIKRMCPYGKLSQEDDTYNLSENQMCIDEKNLNQQKKQESDSVISDCAEDDDIHLLEEEEYSKDTTDYIE